MQKCHLIHKIGLLSLIILTMFLSGCGKATQENTDEGSPIEANSEDTKENDTENNALTDGNDKTIAYPKEPTVIKDIILVNKQHPLPLGYDPGENETARRALDQMLAAYKTETGATLTAFSAYRTFEYQKGLFDRYAASDGYENALMYSARPRFSEHETGLAFDIGGSDQSLWLKEAFEDTPEGIWLKENSAEYGFILRYPKDKTDITGYIYEPWHFRYVGLAHAQEIYGRDITLEEYLFEN